MFESLWGEEFSIKEETPKQTKKIIEKVTKPKEVTVVTEKVLKSRTVDIKDKLRLITEDVLRILGKFKDNTVVIKTKQQLHEYIDKAISNGEIAIDTETNNSLQPVTCKLMGPCIYTPGMKNAYIPLNHVNVDTRERLEWQLTEEDVREEFERLTNTLIIMHNGSFDYRVIKCTCGIELNLYWDTLIAARLLDENEKANLKEQYIAKIDSSMEKYDIEHLFQKVEYAVVDPDIFALYAATDAFMTYKLYKWQQEQFKKPQHDKLYKLFMDVEMPVVTVTAEMELYGVSIDTDYAVRLGEKYHKKVEEIDKEIAVELAKFDDIVAEWRKTPEANIKTTKVSKTGKVNIQKSKSEQLENPISVTSPAQLAILFYDILKVPVVDKKSPRGTGEEILEKIDLPICKVILKKRGLEKIIGTYVDKLPECIIPKTGKVHASFNQIGADTGRFSSKDPNVQNIPSHLKEIRMLFKASPGCVMVGSDFSQQEPRLLSQYSQDANMINAYKQGKDLYATIAMGVYNTGYWDCMEHWEDGSPNPEGKKRRGSVKAILLGIMYGRGTASIAEQIGGTVEEAQKIVDNFFESFPQVKQWMDKTESDAKKYGFVEDLWGRRRRLPDIQLPRYEARFIDSNRTVGDFNPLLGSKGLFSNGTNDILKDYEQRIYKCKGYKETNALKKAAEADGVHIHDNGRFISQAERQCVNARIQGGAATMSKRAMIKVHHDSKLKELGFRLMIPVHDELIGECPIENAQEAADRLCELMKSAALPEVTVPFKCDPTIEPCWYYSDYCDNLKKDYKKLVEKIGEDEAFNSICKDYCESTPQKIRDILTNS